MKVIKTVQRLAIITLIILAETTVFGLSQWIFEPGHTQPILNAKNKPQGTLWWLKEYTNETLLKEDLTDERQSWLMADEQIQNALTKEKYSHLKEVYCTTYVNAFNNTLFLVLSNTSKKITNQFISIGTVENRTKLYEYKIPASIINQNHTEYSISREIIVEKNAPVHFIFRKCIYNNYELMNYIKKIRNSKSSFEEKGLSYKTVGLTVNGTILITLDEVTPENVNKIASILNEKVPADIIVIRKGVNFQQTAFPSRTQEHNVLIGGIKIETINATWTSTATLGFIARNLYEDEIGIITVEHFKLYGGNDVYQPDHNTNPNKIGDIDVMWNTTTDACWIEIDDREYLAKIYNITADQVLVDEEPRDNNSIRIGQLVWWNGMASNNEAWGTVDDVSWDWNNIAWIRVDCTGSIKPISGDSGSPVYRKRYDAYPDVWRAEPLGLVEGSSFFFDWWLFTSLDIVEEESGDKFDFRLDRDFSEFTHRGSGSFTYSDYYQDNHITTLYNNEDAWDYEDKGIEYFDDWIAELTVDADSHGTQSGGAYLFAISNEINDWQDIDDGVGLYLTYAVGAGEWRLFLKARLNGITTDEDYYVTDTALKRVTIKKEGTDIWAFIYDNENRTMFVDSLYVFMNSTQSFRYVFSVMSNNSGKSAAYFTGDVTEFAYWPQDNK